MLTPLGRVQIGSPTTKRSGLTRQLAFTDNTATATNELRIQTNGADLPTGSGVLLEVAFKIAAGAAEGAAHGLTLNSASLTDQSGTSLTVETAAAPATTLAASPQLGDLNGDGVTNEADLAVLNQLVVGRKTTTPTASQKEAGDMNADDQLDQHDVILLRRQLGNLPNSL